ncbi:DUF4199 domain-containing protein [Flavobacterium sp. RHBU_24]|uniref:DUF4199 domain-containing protein n=1 Tax=Flavobacterium sp. RHBU_24 TaxID=3391185 RepID=UPI003984ED18
MSTLTKSIIIHGLIGGAVSLTGFLLMGCTEDAWGMVAGFASMILAFSLIFVAVKNYRDKQNGGVISFGKALQIGLLITLVTATVYVVVWLIDYAYFNPDFLEKYTASTLKAMANEGATATQIKAKATEMKEFRAQYDGNVFYRAGITYTEIVPVGIIISIIAALILKKKRNEQQGELATS